ncbi:MAG: hypothetical protein DRR08_14520 [Candidatus Parabeggiatoa sp. nov. 2]|nr:MAG: hypothetical protein DRR08_14520 [Gammaproteobacteria bacterium]
MDKRICAIPKVGQVVELIGTGFINGPLIARISELSTAKRSGETPIAWISEFVRYQKWARLSN